MNLGSKKLRKALIVPLAFSAFYSFSLSCSSSNQEAKNADEIRQLREYVDQRLASIDSSLSIISQNASTSRNNINILNNNLQHLIDQLNEGR
jgi:hypothetical protein